MSFASSLRPHDTRWTILTTTVAIGAGFAARHATKLIWEATTDQKAPRNPAYPTTSWGEAVAWTAASAVGIGVARLLARRGAALWWREQIGALPEKP